MEEKSRLTFRISLWRPWLLALTPLALLAALGVAFDVVGGKLAAAQAILLVFAGVAVALLLPIGLVVWASRSHEIRNEILASEQKNEKHVPLTYCQDNRKRR